METVPGHVKNTLIWTLLLIFIKNGLCINIVEDLKDAVLNTENLLGDTLNQIEKMASHFKFVRNAWEDTVEEDCVYSCPNGKRPVPNKYHRPHSNGCGVKGMEIKMNDLPFKEMTRCCDAHDICYGTCGSDRDSCDLIFKRCLYNICDDQVGKLAVSGCKTGAKLLYTGTNVLGCKYFKDAQKEACYCPQERDRKYKGNDEL